MASVADMPGAATLSAMKIILPLALVSILSPPASLQAMQQDSHIRRDDLVVMGYVTAREYEALDEFGMSSIMTADLKISKVLRGRAPGGTLTIRYVAHMDLPENSELRFHLRRSSAGAWLVCKQGRGQGYICK
ncbi:hypothetical protein IAG41_22820 [Sphingomonas sp. JC676]|uniref:hypothetical protein n=1 Tax=Sphingomonas sp. JC676 TaxID=2768065 RepID=UPI001657CFB0|nr:hypothetical protein [Sphingomonas sp. JC676]MBC9035234.1 hypothetical protein [Sphingomonas sp. JC676]